MLDSIFFHGLDLLALVLPISIAATNIIFFPLLALWLLGAEVTFQRWPLRWGLNEKVFLVFLVISVASALGGVDVRRGIREIWKTDLYIFIALFLTAMLASREKHQKLLRIFLWAGGLMAFWGLVQFAVGVNQTDKSGGYFLHLPAAVAKFPRVLLDQLSMVNGRVLGTRGHPLSYAECLLFNWAFGLCFLLNAQGKQALKWLGYLLLIAGGLVVSQSRGPWLAAAVMLVIAACAAGFKRSWPIILLGALVLMFFRASPSFHDRAVSIADKTHHSNSDRLNMWRAGWTLFKEHPALGVGPGNIKRVSPRFQAPEDRQWGPWGHLHSNYMNILAERGGLGFLTWLLYMLVLCWEWRRGYQKSTDAYSKMFFSAAGLSMVGFMVGGLTETSYNSVVVMMTFYFVVGLSLALIRHPHES